MNISLYRPKELAYKFVLFYNMSEKDNALYKKLVPGKPVDDALLTYCYIDVEQGLSYRVICWGHLTGPHSIVYSIMEHRQSDLTLRENAIDCDAYVLTSDSSNVTDVDKRILAQYGYHDEMIAVHDDIDFDAYRHPLHPEDIQVEFITEDHNLEKLWVREKACYKSMLMGELLNEPYEDMGIHMGDEVIALGVKTSDTGSKPVAILSWIEEKMKKGEKLGG